MQWIPSTGEEHMSTEKQEPVVWFDPNACIGDDCRVCSMQTEDHTIPLYTHPPKRKWQSLTDDEIKEIVGSYAGPIKGYTRELFDKIDAKLREKNGG